MNLIIDVCKFHTSVQSVKGEVCMKDLKKEVILQFRFNRAESVPSSAEVRKGRVSC